MMKILQGGKGDEEQHVAGGKEKVKFILPG
jgi:hypothetical protein